MIERVKARMKRTQVAALLAGAALGMAGVAIAVVLSRAAGSKTNRSKRVSPSRLIKIHSRFS
jgi:hypothetical protein